jgi:O-acetyl-ADP-ribose deacetylase (regulator of RNase III)
MKVSSKIAYLRGDATRPSSQGAAVIAHICNDEGKWGKGFVLAISSRWKEPEAHYREQYRQNPKPQLGDVQFVKVEPQITVANMIGQHGVRRGSGGAPPIRYEAVEQGLKKVAAYASEHEASVHMPRIGCGLAGGNWEEIEPVIQRTLLDEGIGVFVYDFAK